jgi:hypothetical protein
MDFASNTVASKKLIKKICSHCQGIKIQKSNLKIFVNRLMKIISDLKEKFEDTFLPAGRPGGPGGPGGAGGGGWGGSRSVRE